MRCILQTVRIATFASAATAATATTTRAGHLAFDKISHSQRNDYENCNSIPHVNYLQGVPFQTLLWTIKLPMLQVATRKISAHGSVIVCENQAILPKGSQRT